MQTPHLSNPSWPAPSPVTIFLRNVHLLQLDQQPDWPGLSRKLFSGGQKLQAQRVKSVEWVLYHLCLLWDPSETKNKLRPFFPPLEPLQSVNLRAALFRTLSDLKKNGDLGREVTVRKTMLDDCKGPRFEEVLADFSTLVLRKVVCTNPKEPGLRCALTDCLTVTETENQVLPLVIAHHSSLNKLKQEHSRARETHDDFCKLLNDKESKLRSGLRSGGGSHPTERPPLFTKLAHDIKSNWLGDQDLVQSLLTGGSIAMTESVLELPFEQARRAKEKAQLGDVDGLSKVNILLKTEVYLGDQHRRVYRLKEFQTSIRQKHQLSNDSELGRPSDSYQSLDFKNHQSLTIANASKLLPNTDVLSSLCQEHQAILDGLKSALSDSKDTQAKFSPDPMQSPQKQIQESSGASSTPSDNRIYLSSPSPRVEVTDFELPQRLTTSCSSQGTVLSPPAIHVGGHNDSEQYQPSNQDIGIAHLTQFESESELDVPALPQFEPRPASLLERTRKSMSLLPPQPTSRTRQSLAGPRDSQRFPVNPFATPPKEQQDPSRSGASTPREELFTDEAEYASIFKSRPRVAHSPLISPAVHVGLDYVEDPLENDDSVLDITIAESPLATKTMNKRI